MDKTAQDDIRPQAGTEFASPLSPKRQKTECTATNDHSRRSRFDFPELLTFRKTSNSPSPASILQENQDLNCTVDEKHDELPEDTKLNVTPITNSEPTASEDEQPPVTETDKLSSDPGGDTDGCLAESEGKSLEDETPAGSSLSTGSNEDGRQMRNHVNQTRESENEEACQADCTGFCRSQFAEVVNSNQTEDEFSDSLAASSNYKDSKLLLSNPEDDHSGNLSEGGGGNEGNKLELQICGNESASVSDGETNGRVNESGASQSAALSAAECAEGSPGSYDVVLDGNTAAEKASLEADDDFCGAEEELAACEIIAEAGSETADHTTAVRISGEAAGGDNDAGPRSEIDPAIWSQTDGRWNSEMETPLEPQRESSPDQTGHENEKTCREPPIKTLDCLWKPRPTSAPENPPHAGDEATQESRNPSKSGCSPVSFDHLKTQEVQHAQSEAERWDDIEEVLRFITEMESGERETPEIPKHEHVCEAGNTSEQCLYDVCMMEEKDAGEEMETDGKENTKSDVSEGFDLIHFSDCEAKNPPPTLVLPPASDAVVPSQQSLNPPHHTDRFPLPLYSRALTGFDTFERIQLSPDDDDDDDDAASGLDSFPNLIGSPQIHPGSPQIHPRSPAEQGHEGRFECHMANGFVSSDPACNELPNFISAADVIALECDSDSVQDEINPESDGPACQFGMKEQFDLVLKELNLFFEISRNGFGDSGPSSPEQRGEITEPEEVGASECKERISSSEPGKHRNTASDDADEDVGLEICGGDPEVSVVSSDGEQEVPRSRETCQKTSVDREALEMQRNMKPWSPSFMCFPLMEQLNHGPPAPTRRLEPLKTCTKPIRVGLSKRAKTKNLHRPHPYK